jgi:hypothetical protein
MTTDDKAGDETLLEDQVDDSTLTEEETADALKDGEADKPADKDNKAEELAKNYKIRAEKAEKELKALRSKPVEVPKKEAKTEDVKALVRAELDNDYLASLEYSDDIKKAIKRVATINETSFKKAESDPYVQSLVTKWKKDNKADDAALSRNNKTGGAAGDDYSVPPDVDVTTKEGRETYDKWLKGAIAQEKKQFKY